MRNIAIGACVATTLAGGMVMATKVAISPWRLVLAGVGLIVFLLAGLSGKSDLR